MRQPRVSKPRRGASDSTSYVSGIVIRSDQGTDWIADIRILKYGLGYNSLALAESPELSVEETLHAVHEVLVDTHIGSENSLLQKLSEI